MEVILALFNRLNSVLESSGIKPMTMNSYTFCRIFESCLLLVNDRLSAGIAVKPNIENGFYDEEIKREIDHWNQTGKR